MEQFLLKKLRDSKPAPDMVDQPLCSIQQHKGILPVRQLSEESCISPRQFRRRFTEKVGVSPKLYSRIKRFNYISNLPAAGLANWMDMVYEGGYYDQAHFIRDFCDFSGKNPSDYVNYNRSLAALVGA
jgi:AraC-like DNA-binding protein